MSISKVAKAAANAAYAPYSGRKEACVIEYISGGKPELCVGVTLENCAYPNSVSAVHSAIVDLRTRHHYTKAVQVRSVHFYSVKGGIPSPRDLGLLAEFQSENFNEVEVVDGKTISLDAYKRPHNPLPLCNSFKYPEGKIPEDYADMVYAGKESFDDNEKALLKECLLGMQKAWPQHSAFCVGAAFQVELEDGSIKTFHGGNVELFDLVDGLCAERTTLCRVANTFSSSMYEGPKPKRVIRGACALFADSLASPCGGCRQNLAEWGAFPMYLLQCDPKKKTYIVEKRDTTSRPDTLKTLLPMAFTPADLGTTASPIAK